MIIRLRYLGKNYSLDIWLNERILTMRRQRKDLPKQLFH